MALRFVILRHEGIENPHFDLLFETSPTEKLAAWRSEVWPIVAPVELMKLSDHRREYLEYEGAISGGRGFVKRVEEGVCELRMMSGGEWEIQFLDGMHKPLVLTRIDEDQWRAVV